MKRLLTILTAFAIIACICGCTSDATLSPETTEIPASTKAPEPTETPESTPVPVLSTDDITKLTASLQYRATGKEIFTFASADPEYATIQGGYFNGVKFYIAAVHQNEEGYEFARILVLDKDGTVLRESEPLPLDHANNITFNTKLNMLVVTHCQSPDEKYDYYSMVDPDTFEITETDYLCSPFFAIAYCPEKDMYASGEWGGQTLDLWRGDLYQLTSKSVEAPETLSQGMFCDADAIYFVRSSQNGYKAEIRMYDWYLRFIRSIELELPDGVEPESINIVEGKTYVVGTNWNTRRGVCYILHFDAAE